MNVDPRSRRGRLRLAQDPRHDDSPEAQLLRLSTDIRRLSGERLFREELLLMEQVFLLLLDGFRPQLLSGDRVGLVPPHPELPPALVGFLAQAPVPAPGAAGDQLCPGPSAVQDQAIETLLKAGMAWVAIEGKAAALCFPSWAVPPLPV